MSGSSVTHASNPHIGGRKNASVKLSVGKGGGAKTAPPLERFPLGAATTVTLGVDWTLVATGPWPGSISRVLVSQMLPVATVAISPDVTGARATAVGLRVAPSRLVSPARVLLWGLLGCHPSALPQSVFDVP